MKAILITLSVFVMVFAPQTAFAASYGKAVGKNTSSSNTQNSISIKKQGNKFRVARNLKGQSKSSGTIRIKGVLDGQGPKTLCISGSGAGASVASGKNSGRTTKKAIRPIKGQTRSGTAMSSTVCLSLD